MKNVLMLEWKRCLHRGEVRFTFALLMFFAVASFAESCQQIHGAPLTNVRSAFDMSMIQGIQAHLWLQVEILLLPLMASVVYADAYYTDLKLGVHAATVTRTRPQSLLWAKFCVNAVTVFLVVLIPLVVNQGLCLVAFPTTGFDNNYGLPPYDIGLQNYTPAFLFDLPRIQSPGLYNLLYMVMISSFASLFSLCTFALYLVLKKGKFVTLTAMYLCFIALDFGLSALGHRSLSIYEVMTPNTMVSSATLWLWMASLCLTSTVIVFWSIRRHEPGLAR